MLIGLPKEIKDHEFRVALTPQGVSELVAQGNRVLVQTGAGAGSNFSDSMYSQAGAELLADASEVFARAELIVKVKEPLENECKYLRRNQLLFTYLHLAGVPELARTLLEKEVTAIAYETVQLPDGTLPLLTPMSEVAGRISVQIAAHYLEKPQNGSGILLGGVEGVQRGKVLILGAGVVGTNAAIIAVGMQADVTIASNAFERLRQADSIIGGRYKTAVPTKEILADLVKDADVIIGAVLIPGAKAPRLVSREMVQSMRPGSVIVDVSVDQGGCIETTRPTSHTSPVYEVNGVIHYCVPNMPGAVPRTSTQALCKATLPYIKLIASMGNVNALRHDTSLMAGLNTFHGFVTNNGVADALGLTARSGIELLSNAG